MITIAALSGSGTRIGQLQEVTYTSDVRLFYATFDTLSLGVDREGRGYILWAPKRPCMVACTHVRH